MNRLFALAVILVGCGNHNSTPPGPDGPPAFVESMPAAMSIPQVINSGGPVLAMPIVQPIFFATDSATQTYVEGFLPQLATSSYWTAIGSEYGVGVPTIMPSIVSSDTVPLTDQAMAAYLQTQLDGTHAGWPAADLTSTIYMVQLPADTAYDGACSDFAGYHAENATETTSGFTYAVVANCGPSGNLTALDEVTWAMSHELIEASTDPKVDSAPAYLSTDTEHLAWGRFAGSEIGDMCEYSADAQQRLVGTYNVQRIWSNASATAGHDPCVPALATPYVNAAPSIGDINITTHSGTVMTEGLTLAVGSSVTIDFKLFSDAPTDDWAISVVDGAELDGGASSFTIDYGQKYSGHNGDTIGVLVTRNQSTSSHGDLLFVENKVGDPNAPDVNSYWWIYVN